MPITDYISIEALEAEGFIRADDVGSLKTKLTGIMERPSEEFRTTIKDDVVHSMSRKCNC